jgi:flagellar hook-associated protein 1 FlgK
MSLTVSLSNAVSGLRINQQAISVLSQNIANVNTPGYSRQIINQSAITIEGLGSGVKLDDITRKIDKYLQRSVQSQGSVSSAASVIDDYYQRVQGLLGQPGSGNSIDGFMTNYFNAVQRLAETPETSSLKSNAVATGAALAGQLSDLAANIYELQFEADREIEESVTAVNNALAYLYDLNTSINQAYTLKQSTAGCSMSAIRHLARSRNT